MSTVLNRVQWFTNTFVFCDSCSIFGIEHLKQKYECSDRE